MKKLESLLKKEDEKKKDRSEVLEEKKQNIENFLQTVDDFILQKFGQPRHDNDGFHPSSLGTASGRCPRKLVYLLQGVEKKNVLSPRILRVMQDGVRMHQTLQTWFSEMGILVAPEIPIVWEDPPIRGHADGIINWEGEDILLEIKTIRSDAFNKLVLLNAPKNEAFLQANIYAYILGLEKIWFVYYNKDDAQIALFEKNCDKILAEKQIDEWRAIYKMFVDGVLPDRPYKKNSVQCKSCELAYHCWSG
jgi:CRISPR/Cas system-associated exonuclease Cas4 (RecB family)